MLPDKPAGRCGRNADCGRCSSVPYTKSPIFRMAHTQARAPWQTCMALWTERWLLAMQFCALYSITHIPHSTYTSSCSLTNLQGVVDGTLTVGDAVLFITVVNQLYVPLSVFGSYYRQVCVCACVCTLVCVHACVCVFVPTCSCLTAVKTKLLCVCVCACACEIGWLKEVLTVKVKKNKKKDYASSVNHSTLINEESLWYWVS